MKRSPAPPLPRSELVLAERVQRLLEESDLELRSDLYREFSAGAELVQALKEEVDRLKDANGNRALLAGQRAFELSRMLADPLTEALGSWALALGLTVQGRFEDALPHFEHARQQYADLDSHEQAARVGIRQVQALAMTGSYERALTLIAQVREIFLGAGLERETGLAFNNTGAIYTRLSQFDKAEWAFRSALERLNLAEDPVGQAQTHVNLGYVCQELDRFREARDHLEKALEIFKHHDMEQSVAGTTLDLALLYRREGHLNSALELLSRARILYDRLGAESDAALAQLEEARVHLDLNLLDEAETLAQELVELFEQREMQLEALEAGTLLGSVLARAGRSKEALTAFEQSRAGWITLGNSVRAARVELQLAALYLQLVRKGEEERAEPGLELVRSGIATLTDMGSRSGRAMGLITQAELLIALGREGEARPALLEADTIAGELGVPDLTIEAKRLLGRWEARLGNASEAEDLFLESIEALESVRATLTVDEFKTSYFGDRLGVYGDMVDLLLGRGREREAFAYVERAKARALVDLLAGGNYIQPHSDDPEVTRLTRELDAAREELNWHYLRAEGDSKSHWNKVIESEKQVTTLLRELERLQPQAAGFERVSLPNLDGIIAEIETDTVLLEYYAVEGNLVAFVVGPDGVRAVTGMGTLQEARERLGQLQFALNRTAQGQAYTEIFGEEMLAKKVKSVLRHLHELLIAPVAHLLEASNLIVVPHGLLSAVPFAALFDGESYLIDRFLLSYAPSATVFSLCRRQPVAPPGPLVAFGVPVEDIPAVRHEVETVVGMFPDAEAHVGPQATLENFRRHAPEARMLHVATHGTFRPGNPMFSGLRMADGWLTARDLYQLHLGSALVVLSACETGLTSGEFGDELMGLSRGFFYAGAPSLTVSHWAVKDEHTAQLMIAFYRHLAQGSTVASALRQAQIEVREQHPNPYHWAAFAVMGDPTRTVGSGAES